MDETHLGDGAALCGAQSGARRAGRGGPWTGRGRASTSTLDERRTTAVTAREPVLSRYPDFAALIAAGEDGALSEHLRRAETIGRPLGSDAFVARLERASGRTLKPAKRGPKPKAGQADISACHRNPSSRRTRQILVHCHRNLVTVILALPPGNQATYLQEVEVPNGTPLAAFPRTTTASLGSNTWWSGAISTSTEYSGQKFRSREALAVSQYEMIDPILSQWAEWHSAESVYRVSRY